MHRNGVMISIDEHQPESGKEAPESAPRETRLIKAIARLIDDPERRRDMSQRGMQLVDGRGAPRIAQKMAASLYPFRAATPADAERMWRWRNDPEVRSVSFNRELIPFDSHQSWLQQRLNDPQSIIRISEDINGMAVGQVRFELVDEGQTALISIIVDQTRRGRGLGTLLIAAGCQELFKNHTASRIIAQVKPSNAASEKAFRAAGFQAIEPTIIGGKMALQFVFERETTALPQRPTLQKSA
jgi:RimJ/RimL family protein N-acetyltransferase